MGAQDDRDQAMWETMAVLVSAMTTTLERLDRIADRVADVAVFAEAIYLENMRRIREENNSGAG